MNAKDHLTDQTWLDTIFPSSRTDAFFEALFGGAEEGAYDIRLVHRKTDDTRVEMAFHLTQRPGQCLRCNLTYGLPEVFAKHPIINVAGVAKALAEELGWKNWDWELLHTRECSDIEHEIPLVLTQK